MENRMMWGLYFWIVPIIILISLITVGLKISRSDYVVTGVQHFLGLYLIATSKDEKNKEKT